MFHVAFPRGQGPAFADLPPTLQPHAIAASAPPSDHLRAVTLSGLIYFSLVAAVVALSSLASPPALAPIRPPAPGPTFVYDPPHGLRLTLPPVGAVRGSGGGVEPTSPAPPAAPAEVPTEASPGSSTENHAMDPVGTGPGTPSANTSPVGSPIGTVSGPIVHDFTLVGLAVVHQVSPIYPDFARKARIQGPVVLMMTVNEQGQPIQVQVVEGHPVFHEAAKQAARQWRFEPALMNGRPVVAAFRLTLNFTLR